jgi:hypothetical protein
LSLKTVAKAVDALFDCAITHGGGGGGDVRCCWRRRRGWWRGPDPRHGVPSGDLLHTHGQPQQALGRPFLTGLRVDDTISEIVGR